jgi:hypothetical protein
MEIRRYLHAAFGIFALTQQCILISSIFPHQIFDKSFQLLRIKRTMGLIRKKSIVYPRSKSTLLNENFGAEVVVDSDAFSYGYFEAPD